MAKKRKFTNTEKAIFSLGFMEGENQLITSINKLKAINRHLADELTRLDIEKPVLADPHHITMTIPVKTMVNIIKVMAPSGRASDNKRYYYVKILKQYLEKHTKEQEKATKRLHDDLQDALKK